jgi:nicotinate-nucleotide pyrophosphorylase (carboxylating)
MKSLPFAPLDPALYREAVRRALAEDLGWGDVTTEATVDASLRAKGVILAKCDCVVAGLDIAAETFRQLDPGVVFTATRTDGDRCSPGVVVAEVRGWAAAMLTAERTALNFLQRLSGVATTTRRFVDAVAGTKARIRDTRKTTPLLRFLEKHAVEVGGGVPHRPGLDGGILVKDNHVRLAGSVRAATRRAVVAAAGLDVEVEVEVEAIEQIEDAIGAGARMLLLDNFSPSAVRDAIEQIAGRVPVEVSGGVRLDNVREYAEAGPDYIAVGALTHSAPAMDISLEIEA